MSEETGMNNTPEELAAWLDGKYARHHERENYEAANLIRANTARIAGETSGKEGWRYAYGLEKRIAELKERLEVSDEHPYDGIECRDETIRLLDEKVARQAARIAELERDAKRYRWLRGNWFAFGTLADQSRPPASHYAALHRAGDVESIDAAIDAALRKEKGEPNDR